MVIEVCGVKEALLEVVRGRLNEGGVVILIGLCHPDSDLAGLSADFLIRKCATVTGNLIRSRWSGFESQLVNNLFFYTQVCLTNNLLMGSDIVTTINY